MLPSPILAAPRVVGGRQRTVVLRTLLVLALSAMAMLAQWTVASFGGGHLPFLFFLPGIVVAATFGGLWPALGVAAIGAINGVFLLRTGPTLMLTAHPGAWAAVTFAGCALLLMLLGRRLHVTGQRASSAELRLRTAEDDAAVGLFEIDLANDTLFASPGFWRLIDRPTLQGPVPLAAWLRVLHPDDVDAAREVMARAPTELRTEVEHRVLLPQGQERWVMTRFRRQDEGEAALIRGVMIDITQRKAAARQLAATQRELQQQLVDLKELHELWGRLETCAELEQQLGHILATLARLHGSTRGLVRQHDEGTLRVVASTGLADVAGATRDAAVHATPLLDRQGRPLGDLVIFLPEPREITARERRLADICAGKAAIFIEQARAEHLAREHDRRFRSVLDASAAGFAILRPVRDDGLRITDFIWVYVNGAAASTWQRSPEELVGRTVEQTFPRAWDDNPLFDAYVAVARDAQMREFEYQTRHSPARDWYHVIASPLDGDVAIWFTNVTARRRNEQALVEADQRKDEFLATLAHELRNPLAPIRQATEIARSPSATEAQKRWSHTVVERQVQHMSLLLDDLLDISRITRGQLRLRRRVCELREVFDAAVEAARPLIDKRSHTFELVLPESPVWIDADPLRLSQVLSNLLTNAAKYTEISGHIRAGAGIDADTLVIEVADNGIGLEDAELARVFEMFSQVTSAQERSEGGLGIGLALSQGLVQLHGGSIEAHSDGPGRGARFIARLPIIRDAPAAPALDMSRLA